MITCVETLSRSIFPVRRKAFGLSAAWWVACLLLNMMTLGDESESCTAAQTGESYVGVETYPHKCIYIYITFGRREEVTTDYRSHNKS